ncbi:hypothetical protein HGO37_22585 [Rhizobium sp. CG4]|nr:hypothetical protein [Rhizobium sp. CG4]
MAPEGNIIVGDSRLLLAAAIEGYGLALISKWIAKEHLNNGSLMQVLSQWTPPRPVLCLYYSRHRHISAGMRAFLAHLRSVDRDFK